MTKETMTVHEGLAELKILASRIEKEIASSVYVNSNKHANTKIDGMSVEEYTEGMKSAYQKVVDLIKRRNAIKRAITKSNAVTDVTLTKSDGSIVTMTVAELIEYKNVGLQFTERLVNTITKQYNTVTSLIKRQNDLINETADKYVTGLYGGKDNTNKDVVESTRTAYIEANSQDLIDPNKIADRISELNAELDFYNTKVDAALSTSNAVTVIEFEY